MYVFYLNNFKNHPSVKTDLCYPDNLYIRARRGRRKPKRNDKQMKLRTAHLSEGTLHDASSAPLLRPIST